MSKNDPPEVQEKLKVLAQAKRERREKRNKVLAGIPLTPPKKTRTRKAK